MNFKYFLLACALLLTLSASAQGDKVNISGTIVDTVNMEHMELSSVAIIRASDSILYSFTRAESNGSFTIPVDKNASYFIIITHPNFASRTDLLTVKENNLNLGNIYMLTKAYLLQEVIVKGDRAIVIKGDTTEYAADSFKVREFDNVEALLKRLPGIEVDGKGNITAHGEKVQKMLVDGDEFFGDDPAVLSKMLRASAIDKVQVFDKKSEAAQLTGIDDGERIKTINLKLKDNAKSGYFGKVEAGGGLPGFWENQAMINSFKNKRKLALFGIMSNTNKVGLGWDDASKYTGGNQNVMMQDDGSVIYYRSEDEMNSYGGSYSGEGLPKTWNTGIYYGDKYGKKQQHSVNTDYRFNKNDLYKNTTTKNQYLLPDTQYVNNINNEVFSSRIQHSLSNRSEIQIDSLSQLVITARGRVNNVHTNTQNQSDYQSIEGSKINESKTSNIKDVIAQSLSTSISYNKKFAKVGRSLAAKASYNYNNSEGDGIFTAVNNFLNSGTSTSFNQRKEDNIKSSNLSSDLTYSEPLVAEKVFLVMNYRLSFLENENANLSYDRFGNTDTLNKNFSSSYNLTNITNAGGANVRFNTKKYTFSFGGNVAHTAFNQYNYFTDSARKRDFINFFPRADFSLNNNRSRNLSIRYNGSTRQPDINQLQPMIVNTDPTNIMVGNPELTQEFNHNLNLNFGLFQVLSQRYFYGNLGFNYIDNAISLKQNISPLGIREYSYVNLDGNMNGYAWVGGSLRAFKDARVSIGLNGNVNRNNTILNNIKTLATNYSIGSDITFNYDKDTTLSFSYNFSHNYNKNFNNTRNDVRTGFHRFGNSLQASYQFPSGWNIGTDMTWVYRQKIYPNDIHNSILLWNGYVSKSFLKDRSLVFKLAGNDILNNNIGFNRTVMDNNITETKFNNIRRYFMLSVTWNFTKSKATDGANDTATDAVQSASTDPDDY